MVLDANTKYAGFWARVIAFLIDGVVLTMISIPFELFLDIPEKPTTFEAFIAILVSVGILLGYECALVSSSWQATPGKKLLGMKVVDYSGERTSFGRATGRFLLRFLSILILLIGVMMVGWTKRKQGLHDFTAKTLVVWVPVQLLD